MKTLTAQYPGKDVKMKQFSKRDGFQKDENLDCPGKVGVDASAIRVEVAEKDFYKMLIYSLTWIHGWMDICINRVFWL